MSWQYFLGTMVLDRAGPLLDKVLGLGSCGEGGGSSTYTIKAGDTLTSIAQAHGTSVQALLAANPSIEDPDLIIAGEQLTIPSGGMGCGAEEDLPENLKAAAEAAGGLGALKEQVETYCTVHTAAEGDTLADIAAGLGACPQLVAKMNPQLQDPTAPLPEGSQVLVPSSQALEEGMGCAGSGSGSEEEGMGGLFTDFFRLIW